MPIRGPVAGIGPHNELQGIQGGAKGHRHHLTESAAQELEARNFAELSVRGRPVMATPGIGDQGGLGFGVGPYPGPAEDLINLGLSEMAGTNDRAAALEGNYGNYLHNNGSVFCCLPKFWYRIGHPDSPRYATYGLNAIDISDEFSSTAEANSAGYALHRVFINAGQEKLAVFRAKYFASKDGEDAVKCVANGVPISLSSNTDYTNSKGMLSGACTGILADAVLLAGTLGGAYHVNHFVESALAILSLAHGQAAEAATYCAWYDPEGTTNYPKGCINNALGDVDDAEISYTTAGDAGNASKPLTGSGAPFAKTTHNGQACGVADVNGVMWRVGLGITTPGGSAGASGQLSHGDAYVLQESADIAALTSGWNTGTDAWGDANHLATLYDSHPGLLPWDSSTGWVKFGNGDNQVFDEAPTGVGWLRTACGIQQDNLAMSSTGTNLFGQDGCYRYNRENLFVLSGGAWGCAGLAGPFARLWNYRRTNSFNDTGFCPSAYGS